MLFYSEVKNGHQYGTVVLMQIFINYQRYQISNTKSKSGIEIMSVSPLLSLL